MKGSATNKVDLEGLKSSISKVQTYVDLLGGSKQKEACIRNACNTYYEIFGCKSEREKDLAFQKKVSARLRKRINDLIKNIQTL